MANPLRFPPVMPCSQQHPAGFILLREIIRNGGIYYVPVQRLHTLVNHRAVHCIRLAVKIFMNFTSVDFGTAKLSRRCALGTAQTSCVRFCTRVLRTSRRFSDRFYTLPRNASRYAQAKAVFRMESKTAVQSVRRVRQF